MQRSAVDTGDTMWQVVAVTVLGGLVGYGLTHVLAFGAGLIVGAWFAHARVRRVMIQAFAVLAMRRETNARYVEQYLRARILGE